MFLFNALFILTEAEPLADFPVITPVNEAQNPTGMFTLNSNDYFVGALFEGSKITVTRSDQKYKPVTIPGKLISVKVPSTDSAEVKLASSKEANAILGYKVTNVDKITDNIETDIFIVHKAVSSPETIENGKRVILYNKSPVTITVTKTGTAEGTAEVIADSQLELLGAEIASFTIAKSTQHDQGASDFKSTDPENLRITVFKDTVTSIKVTQLQGAGPAADVSDSFYVVETVEPPQPQPKLELIEVKGEQTPINSLTIGENEIFIGDRLDVNTITVKNSQKTFKAVPVPKKLMLAQVPSGETASISLKTAADENKLLGFKLSHVEKITGTGPIDIFIARQAALIEQTIVQGSTVVVFNKATIPIKVTTTPESPIEEIPVNGFVELNNPEITSFEIAAGSSSTFEGNAPKNIRVSISKATVQTISTLQETATEGTNEVIPGNFYEEEAVVPPTPQYPTISKVEEGETPTGKFTVESGKYFIGNKLTDATISVKEGTKTYKSVSIPNNLALIEVPAGQRVDVNLKSPAAKNTLFGYLIDNTAKINLDNPVIFIVNKAVTTESIEATKNVYVFNQAGIPITITKTPKSSNVRKALNPADGNTIELGAGECTVLSGAEVSSFSIAATQASSPFPATSPENIRIDVSKTVGQKVNAKSIDVKGQLTPIEQKTLYIEENTDESSSESDESEVSTDESSLEPETEGSEGGSSDSNADENGLSGGAIAGITIGVIAFVAIIAGVVVYFLYFKKKAKVSGEK